MPSIEISQETRNKLIQVILELNKDVMSPLSYDELLNYLLTLALNQLTRKEKIENLKKFASIRYCEELDLELRP